MLPVKLAHWLRSAKVPVGLVPWLPLTSRTFGPPRRRAGVVDYFSRHEGRLTEVYAASAVPVPRVVQLDEADPSYVGGLRATLPPAYVFSLPEACLLGSAGWVVGRRDTLLVEASFWREPDFPHPFSTHFILTRKRTRPLRRLRGRCLSLASDFAVGGFGHFIHDSLPRLHLAEKAGYRLSEFDWVYLPRVHSASVETLVSRLGLPPGRLLNHDSACDLECEELVATTFPGSPGNIPAYTPEFLRSRFTPAARPRGRRLYLSRAGGRRYLANAAGVEAMLAARGFETILPDSANTADACAEAGVIVAQEGANFMNALFAPPGARLLLLLPRPSPNLPYAFTLARAAGHELWVLTTPMAGSSEVPVLPNPALLEPALDRLLAPSVA
jgi:hypothetical protein